MCVPGWVWVSVHLCVCKRESERVRWCMRERERDCHLCSYFTSDKNVARVEEEGWGGGGHGMNEKL